MTAQWKPIIHECRNHVPIIEGVNHLGAGVLVSPEGLVITNAHVVDEKATLLVSLHDGTRAKGVMIHRHERADLAIVRAAIHTRHFFGCRTAYHRNTTPATRSWPLDIRAACTLRPREVS